MMEINKKSAPQRTVIDVIKTGNWGKVEYLHKLECGHTEVRKRHAGTAAIACTGCVKAQIAEITLKSLSPAQSVYIDSADIHDPVATEVATVEQDIGRIRASLASALGVTVSDVELIVTESSLGEPSVTQAMVFLGPSAINNIINSVK